MEIALENTIQNLNPWQQIWFRPRKTLRFLFNSYNNTNTIILTYLIGIFLFLDQSIERSVGDYLSLMWILILAFTAGGLMSFIRFAVGGMYYEWVGGWFGGNGKSRELRIALTWSSTPKLLWVFSLLPIILIYGQEWFQSEGASYADLTFLLLFGLNAIIGIIATLWEIVLKVICLSETHQFSIWKSILTLVTGSLIIFVPLLLLLALFR